MKQFFLTSNGNVCQDISVTRPKSLFGVASRGTKNCRYAAGHGDDEIIAVVYSDLCRSYFS